MKKTFVVVFTFFLTIMYSQVSKKALIIAIGNYPEHTGWDKINSVNDISLISQALKLQGFQENNINTLIDEKATKLGILNAFAELEQNANKGDIIVIHISAHGQQVSDLGYDEIDGLDEAIIPYDASKTYNQNYKGENHLVDDEINVIISRLRKKLGKEGQLLMLLDTCHSGTATRGSKIRGTSKVFIIPEGKSEIHKKSEGSDMYENRMIDDNKKAPFILISAAASNENNFEYKGYGSLSYAFANAISTIDYSSSNRISYRQLFGQIKVIMSNIVPNQTPVIEGNQDFEMFGKEKLIQKPYFKIVKTLDNEHIEINGGKIQGIFNNSTLLLCSQGSLKPSEANIISKGKVVKSFYGKSIIHLEKPIIDFSKEKYWVFIDKMTFSDIHVAIYFDDVFKNSALKNKIENYLKVNNLGALAKSKEKADLIIFKPKDNIINITTNDSILIYDSSNDNPSKVIKNIKSAIFNFGQGQFVKTISIKNYDYEFEFRYIPINVETGDQLEYKDFINEKGIFQVRENKDHVILEIENFGNYPFYFNVLEINSKGELYPTLNYCEEYYSLNELIVNPGNKKRLNLCEFYFAPPYEKLILKGFATTRPINFDHLINTRGNIKGDLSPLEKLLSNSFKQSRGGDNSVEINEEDCFTNEFVYIITNYK